MLITFVTGCNKNDETNNYYYGKIYEHISLQRDIKELNVNAGWTVYGIKDVNSRAKIEYKGSLNDNIIVEVKDDGSIYLDMKGSGTVSFKKEQLIYIPDIEKITLSGGSDAIFSRKFLNDNCDLRISGGFTLSGFDIDSKFLIINMDGSSNCKIKGKVENATINCSGASSADILDMSVHTLDTQLKGASDLKISVEEKITGTISGVSTLIYRGTPDVFGSLFKVAHYNK